MFLCYWFTFPIPISLALIHSVFAAFSKVGEDGVMKQMMKQALLKIDKKDGKLLDAYWSEGKMTLFHLVIKIGSILLPKHLTFEETPRPPCHPRSPLP